MQPDQLDIDRLVTQYGSLVLKQAYFYLKDRHKAEDVCQEVFLRVLKKQPVLGDAQSEKAYLLRVTINICKDILKSAWNRRVYPMAEGYDAPTLRPGPENTALKSEENRVLFNCVLELPDIYKDVVLLFYYHDLSTAEIARILSTPEVTVRTRLMRARNRLAVMLKESEPNEP